MAAMYPESVPQFTFRFRRQVEVFFAGLDVLTPGVVPIPMWHPDLSEDQDRNPENFEGFGGVGRKF